jgi:hypothetical protein
MDKITDEILFILHEMISFQSELAEMTVPQSSLRFFLFPNFFHFAHALSLESYALVTKPH